MNEDKAYHHLRMFQLAQDERKAVAEQDWPHATLYARMRHAEQERYQSMITTEKRRMSMS